MHGLIENMKIFELTCVVNYLRF